MSLLQRITKRLYKVKAEQRRISSLKMITKMLFDNFLGYSDKRLRIMVQLYVNETYSARESLNCLKIN